MDELEIRRRLFADPNDQSDELMSACEEQRHNDELKKELQLFDHELKAALEVDVPDNLAERIILNQKLNASSPSNSVWRGHFAIAASIAAIFAVTVSVFSPFSERQTNMIDHALAHYHAEADHIPPNTQSSLDELNEKLASFGASVVQQVTSLSQIRFASFCTFQGTRSLHLVFRDGDKEVTVFVVPKNSGLIAQSSSNTNQTFGKNANFMNADVVVLSDNEQLVDKWLGEIKEAISWQKA